MKVMKKKDKIEKLEQPQEDIQRSTKNLPLLHIPLDFDTALEGLLNTKPKHKTKDKPKK